MFQQPLEFAILGVLAGDGEEGHVDLLEPGGEARLGGVDQDGGQAEAMQRGEGGVAGRGTAPDGESGVSVRASWL